MIMTSRKTSAKGESTVVKIQNCGTKTADVINTYGKIAKIISVSGQMIMRCKI